MNKSHIVKNKLNLDTRLYFLNYLLDTGREQDFDFVEDRLYSVCNLYYNENKYNHKIISLLLKLLGNRCEFNFKLREIYDEERDDIVSIAPDNLDDFLKNKICYDFFEKLDILPIAKLYNQFSILTRNMTECSSQYRKVYREYSSFFKAPFITYSIKHKINFGKAKGKTLLKMLQTDPSFIVFSVLNLKHFLIDYDTLLNPLLLDYLDDKYYEFAFISIVKEAVCTKLQDFYVELSDTLNELDDARESKNREFAENAYYIAYESDPENYFDY